MAKNEKSGTPFDPEEIKRHFADSCEDLVRLINDTAGEVDCEHAFVAFVTSNMLKLTRDGGYVEAEHGSIPALVELAAFHLYPHFGKSNARDTGKYQKLFDALEQLNAIRGLDTALQVRLQLYAEGVRGSSFPPQIRLRIEKIQGIHEAWFNAKVGIGPLRALEILDAYEGLANANMAEQKTDFQKLTDRMMLVAETLTKSLTTQDELPEGEALRDVVGGEFQDFIENSSEMLAVSFDQLSKKISDLTHLEWTSLQDLAGLTVSNRKSITHPRELRSRPIYFLTDDRFVVVDLSSAFDAVFEAFDAVTRTDQRFRDTVYINQMSSWMESEASNYLLRVFPSESVYLQLTYPDPDKPGREAELDGAVLWGPFLVLMEVKGRQFRPRSRLGDPSRLRDDLKDSIEDAFDQASRATRYISQNDVVIFKEKGTTRELRFKRDAVRRIYPMSVTLHHFGGLATQLAMLKRLGLFKDAAYPWSLSLSDLDIITRFAGSPDVFLHYAHRRIELQESQEQILSDELDLFGLYLDCRLFPGNLWEIEEGKEAKNRLFHFGGGSERFDEWYQAEQGILDERPDIKLDLPEVFLEVLEELRKRDDDGARWIAFSLLGLSNSAVSQFTDGLDRIRKHAVSGGRIGRVTFAEGDLVVSIIGGEGIDDFELKRQVTARCALEKYRIKAARSMVFGIQVEDRTKPFNCACWLEGEWEDDAELENTLKRERPKLLTGQKLPGRNDKCLCGSGAKFKKCCLAKFKS